MVVSSDTGVVLLLSQSYTEEVRWLSQSDIEEGL